MPTQVDYEQEAVDRMPPFLADGENMRKLAAVFAARWQRLDDVTKALAEAIELSDDSPTWVLDLIGEWLNEPRRGAWSDETYLYALRVKQRTRKSNGTWPDVYEVARLLRHGPRVMRHSTSRTKATRVGAEAAVGWLGGLHDAQLQIYGSGGAVSTR